MISISMLPWWGRLARATFVGTLCGKYAQDEINSLLCLQPKILNIIPALNSDVYKRANQVKPYLGDDLHSAVRIIEQSFRDVNFKGPVYVRITTPEKMNAKTPLNLGTTAFQAENGQTAAYVEMISFPTEITDHESFFRDVYATGGHEAIHVLHHHHVMRTALLGAIVGFSPIVGLAMYPLLEPIFAKLTEAEADITSAFRLGTGLDNAKKLAAVAELKKIANIATHDETHPSLATRVNYLTFFSNFTKKRDSRLLESSTYQEIMLDLQNRSMKQC